MCTSATSMTQERLLFNPSNRTEHCLQLQEEIINLYV